MTSAGGTAGGSGESGGGGSSFTHGDDFVAARLSIDIPTDGISSLRELTQEIERFRVGAESAARAEDNFVSYLTQSAEAANRAAAAQRNLVEQMQRTMALQQRASTESVAGGGLNAPGMYADPFAEMTAGRGTPLTASQAQSQIDSLRERNPRAYLNMQAARGNLRAGDIPTEPLNEDQLRDTAEKVHQREQHVQDESEHHSVSDGEANLRNITSGIGEYGGLARQAMAEMGPGGSFTRLGGIGARVLGKLGDAGKLGNGLVGTFAKGAGVAGLGITAGLGASELFQRGGEAVQGLKNQGMIRGGGVAEGFDQELSIRALALNPFLSTEQSRQVIQAAMTEGYSGKQFDTVTKFIASNLTDMNIQVGESVQMLRKNVNEGGQSIEGLAANLGMLKELSKTGIRSLPDLQSGLEATSGALINAGVSGPQAEKSAMVAGQVWSDDMTLGDQFEQIVQSMASSPSGQAAAFSLSGTQIPQGALPGTLFARAGGGNKQVAGMLKKLAQMAHHSYPNDVLNAASMFHHSLQRYAPGITFPAARKMYERLIGGEDPLQAASQRADEAKSQQLEVQERGFWPELGSETADLAYDIGATVFGAGKDMIADIGSVFSGDWGAIKRRSAKGGKEITDRWTNKSATEGRYHIPMLDSVMKQYGRAGIEILDEEGEAHKLEANNRDMMRKLSSGEYTWRQKGTEGPGMKLSDTPQNPTQEKVAEVQGTLHISMDATARQAGLRAPTAVRLTPHEEKANRGYGDATPNNAPPGESAITRGRR